MNIASWLTKVLQKSKNDTRLYTKNNRLESSPAMSHRLMTAFHLKRG